MLGLGMGEMAIVGGLVLLVFGGKKIPELGGAMAKGIKNFQSGLRDADDKIEDKAEDKEKIDLEK